MIQRKEREPRNISGSTKKKLYAIVFALALTSTFFRFLTDFQFEQSSLLFIGIPTILTLTVIRHSWSTKTAYGMMAYVITVFLLMSSVLFGEGVPCIIFASPLFYGIGALIIFIYRRFNIDNRNNMHLLVVIPAVIIIGQAAPLGISHETHEVSTSITIDHECSLEDMNTSPNFMKNYPDFFRLGFPKPAGITGNGMHIGDERKIQFNSDTRGMGTLHLRLVKRTHKEAVFEIVSDNTHIHHWMSWKKVSVSIDNTPSGSTIKWTSKFTCDLGPSWYFIPLEKYTVDIMNEHLINSYFNTPPQP